MTNFENQGQSSSKFEQNFSEKFALWKTLIQDSNVQEDFKELLMKHLLEADEPHYFIARFAQELDSIDTSWVAYDAAAKQELNLGIKNINTLSDRLKDPYTLYAELREDMSS